MNSDRYLNFSCDDLADGFNAPRDRAFVWHVFSALFLDCSWADDELSRMAEFIAGTKFTIQELSHILSEEVAPVCSSNKLFLFGGESIGFSLEWLLEKCSARQNRKPYASSGRTDQIPSMVHIKAPVFFEAYLMLYRVKRLRNVCSDS
jgi:hypothetical protein